MEIASKLTSLKENMTANLASSVACAVAAKVATRHPIPAMAVGMAAAIVWGTDKIVKKKYGISLRNYAIGTFTGIKNRVAEKINRPPENS